VKGSLVFVHGTGVRAESYTRNWARISARLPQHGLGDVTMVPCRWGEHVGPTYETVAVTVPGTPPTSDLDHSDGPGAWAVLVADPLFELRVAGQQPPRSSGPALPGQALPPERARALLAQLAAAPPPGVAAQLVACGLDTSDLAAAASVVGESDELAAAATTAPDVLDPELVDVIARALVAAILAGHRNDQPGAQPDVAYDRALRTGLVEALHAGFAPGVTVQAIDFTGWIKGKFSGFVKGAVSSYVEPRYAGILGNASPPIGDILYYQQRGDEIRDFVRDVIARCTELPVVVVGHSLGGIVLVDLLTEEHPPHVDLLVTAGSQSPYFYAIDALANLRRGDHRQPFQPWLNIFSTDDFLSFRATEIFDGDGITDEQVELGVPFPESHSAYWTTERVYDLIAAHWPGA